MPLSIRQICHGQICQGWDWTVKDESMLAECIARIALGKYKHTFEIMKHIQVTKTVDYSFKKSAVALLDKSTKCPYNRDGWLFQAISWIASMKENPKALNCMPHIIWASKGADGLQIELNDDETQATALVIFEDKATENPKNVMNEIWKYFSSIEDDTRRVEFSHSLSGLAWSRVSSDSKFDIDKVAETVWQEKFHYRVSIATDQKHNDESKREATFAEFCNCVPGGIERRRANTMYLPELRKWLDDLACLAIKKIDEIVEAENV